MNPNAEAENNQPNPDNNEPDPDEVFNEPGAIISMKKYPKFHRFMKEIQLEESARAEMSVGE